MREPEQSAQEGSCAATELCRPTPALFDPRGEWIPERLRGFVLVGGEYAPIAPTPAGRLPCHTLGLELAVVDGRLRLFRPGDDRALPTAEERAARADAENVRLREELARRAERDAPE